jgi:DNA-binding NarL/FixJ family response regulator
VPITVVVADDQLMVRDGLVALLSAAPGIEVLGEAGDGEEAVAVARALAPDVVLMDVRMPRLDGIAATARLLGDPPPTDGPRVVVLTTFDLDEYVYAALAAGASGFLLKDAPAADLVHALHVVAGGEALLAPSVTRRLIAEFARRQRAGLRPGSTDALTPRELDVLRQVARGLSNGEIAAELVLAEQTVKTHVSRILAKLGLRDRTQAVVYAYENGIVS